jgi:hypothetical protein
MFNLKWLRAMGPVGSFLANVIALLATSWGVVLSALLGVGATFWAFATDFVQDPRIQTGAEVFLAVFWTYIGFVVLRTKRLPTSVRIYHDYAYGLAFEMAQLAIDPDLPDHLAVNFSFRNVSAGPIKCRVEDMRVILAGRTADHPDSMPKEFMIPRVTAKGYRSAAIPWDQSKNSTIKGAADLTIIYGHPEIGYERKLRMKFELGIAFEHQKMVGFTAGIGSEIDTPYRVV